MAADDIKDDGLMAAAERIAKSCGDDIDGQVDREILRYWNERVRNAGDDAEEVRRIRTAIFQRITDAR